MNAPMARAVLILAYLLALVLLPACSALETEIGSDFTDNTGHVYDGEHIAYGVALEKDERFTAHLDVKDGKALDLYVFPMQSYLTYKGNATQVSGAIPYLNVRLAEHTQPYAKGPEKYYVVVDNKDNGINDSKPMGDAGYTLSIKFNQKRLTQSSDDNRTPLIALAFVVLIVGLTVAAFRAKLFGKKHEDLTVEEFIPKKAPDPRVKVARAKASSAKAERSSAIHEELSGANKPVMQDNEQGPKKLLVEDADRIEAEQDLQLLGMKHVKQEPKPEIKPKSEPSKPKPTKAEVERKAEEVRSNLHKDAKGKGPIVCDKCGARIYAKRLTCPECNAKLPR